MDPSLVLVMVLGVLFTFLVIAFFWLRARSEHEEDAKKQQLNARRGAVVKRQNWLVGIEGDVAGKTYHIGQREATLGRKVGNYIQLMDEKVSRVHTKVRASRGGGLEVIDEDSEIGTFVNGERLESGVARMIQDGDVIAIGVNKFRFEATGDHQVNHGLTEQKVAGAAQNKATAAMSAMSWQNDVKASLEAAGGDVEGAAKHMGVDVEVFKKMMEQAGIAAGG
jgi:hypothetical protein